ncbi:MAG TPA: hypothetical protein VFQ94_04810 [Gallionella sp.]|nr:hypothetical protein [Gallionella sp.]
MSRLWSERLCIALLPDRLVWAIPARGWGRRIRAQGSVTVSAAAEGNLWQAALEALQREVPDIPVVRAEVSVVLSNAFVRYLVINSSTALSNDEERLALARHDFQNIHGVLAEAWEIRIAAGEQNYLAAALDGELLEQLRHCFAATKLKLHSVQPYAVAAFNHWSKHFNGKSPEGFFLPEPHGYCYAGMSGGQWEFFHCGRWEGEPLETYQRVVQREALRSGIYARKMWMAPVHESSLAKNLTQQDGVQLLPLRDELQAECLTVLLGAA